MKTIFNSVQALISQLRAIAILGSGICLFAGEIRFAALRKASQGSSKLSAFTERMTGTKILRGK